MSVLVDCRDAVAVVTLARPERMNAVDSILREALIETLGRLNADPDVGAIVLTGAGDRAFSAGQDLSESSRITPLDLPRWLSRQADMYAAVRALDKGCVAAFNGVAAGAGFQIGLCADLRIGHAGIRIGQPEVKAGLASVVGSYLMSLYVGHGLNRQLSLTGDLISGARAYEIGLLNDLVEPVEVLPRAIEVAGRMAALPPTAVRLTKQRFRMATQSGFDEACTAGIRYQLEGYASGEPQAAQQAFLDRNRTPR